MYQLIKLYFRLFFKNNKGLLIILILLFTSFSTLYINLHQTKINRDTTTQIYDQYIDKYSGIPNNSKEKQILKELDSYENNEDILKEYQNHQINQKEYLKKQRKNNSNILKKDALNSFYLYYLKIKNTQHKEIVNTRYTDCLNFNNLDFIIILFLFFLIYSIYLKEIDDLQQQYQRTVDASKTKTLVFADRFPFRYLMNDYSLNYYAAFPGCSAEIEASFSTVTFLASKIDELNLSYVIVVDLSDKKMAKTIINCTKNKDQKIVTLDSLQAVKQEQIDKGYSYLKAMKHNLKVLKKCLE